MSEIYLKLRNERRPNEKIYSTWDFHYIAILLNDGKLITYMVGFYLNGA